MVLNRVFIKKGNLYSAEREDFLKAAIAEVEMNDLSNGVLLAKFFKEGDGISRCDKCYEYLLAKMAEQGDEKSAFDLAMHYKGINKFDLEFLWLNIAGEMGSETAKYELDRHSMSY